MKESQLEALLVKYCNRRGFLCWKFVSPGLRGVPDRIVIANGVVFFVELKSPKGRITNTQRNVHSLIRSYGVAVLLVSNMETLEDAMARFRNAWIPPTVA